VAAKAASETIHFDVMNFSLNHWLGRAMRRRAAAFISAVRPVRINPAAR
jgi:hypothetical protein